MTEFELCLYQAFVYSSHLRKLYRMNSYIRNQCSISLNFCYFDFDVFDAMICTMINRSYKFIHFPTVLIADATKALAAMTASLGDLPLAR